jgi:hypothetical protein
MKSKSHITTWLFFGLVLGLITIFISGEARGAAVENNTDSSAITGVYLPITVNNSPWNTSFGTQVKSFNDSGVMNLAKDSGVQWIRMDTFRWGKIEPQNTNASGYKWSAVDEASLIAAYQNGMQVIGIIRDTPAWAQKIPPYSCGAISQSAMPEFANFVRDLVKRYSVPPYNVHHWELWNEPDIVYSPELGYDSVFGCWGDASQTYYGGVYYGEMLNVAYPAIKGADPYAQVGIGGLLLDCDPTVDSSCKSGKFLNGIIRETGIHERGDNFDFISFHGYAAYSSASGLSLDENHPKWKHRGGVVLGKLDYIRHVLNAFHLEKPIYHTEGALLCPEYNTTDCTNPGSNFEEAQADYVVWLFVRNWANDVDVTVWYELQGPGWRYGGLLDGSQSPKPAYNALQFLTQELEGASYIGRVLENTAVDAYEFTRKDVKVWVMWSPDEMNHTVSLPSSALQAYNKYGVLIPITSNQITVNSPVYVELPR